MPYPFADSVFQGLWIAQSRYGGAGCLLRNFSAPRELPKYRFQVSTKQENTELPWAGQSDLGQRSSHGAINWKDLIAHLEMLAVESGFVNAQKSGNTITRLRRLFMRQHLDETEVQILRGLLRAIEVSEEQSGQLWRSSPRSAVRRIGVAILGPSR